MFFCLHLVFSFVSSFFFFWVLKVSQQRFMIMFGTLNLFSCIHRTNPLIHTHSPNVFYDSFKNNSPQVGLLMIHGLLSNSYRGKITIDINNIIIVICPTKYLMNFRMQDKTAWHPFCFVFWKGHIQSIYNYSDCYC